MHSKEILNYFVVYESFFTVFSHVIAIWIIEHHYSGPSPNPLHNPRATANFQHAFANDSGRGFAL